MKMNENVCRACLKDDEKTVDIYENYHQHNLPNIIFDLTGLKIDPSENLSKRICDLCCTRLIDAFIFRSQFLESNVILRSKYLTNTNNDYLEIYKSEIPVDLDWHDDLECLNKLDDIEIEKDQVENSDLINSNDTIEHCDSSQQTELKKDENIEVSNKNPSKKQKHKLHNKLYTKCPMCPKQFSHKSNLKRHLSVHKGKDALSCDKCDESFIDPNALYDHIKIHVNDNEDKGENLLTCHLCGEFTLSFSIFYNHMKNVHNITDNIKPFKCRICDMKFASKQGMYRHIDNIHENNRRNLRNRDKNYLCNTCGKSFYTNFHLHVHVRSHTGEKPFKCVYCEKSFSQMSGLKMHTFIHTGERPFACKICPKTFNQYGHVREHMLTHSDTRPHVCNVCNHSFRVKGNLTAHMLIHSGKKPHVCEHCGKRYLQSAKLRKHMTINHNENV